jgi:hypothetical protein
MASLLQELAIEASLKLQAEAAAADLAMEVASGRAEIIRLNTEERRLRE